LTVRGTVGKVYLSATPIRSIRYLIKHHAMKTCGCAS